MYIEIIAGGIIADGTIKNVKIMQGLENIYYQKLRYEHHHKRNSVNGII